MTRLEFIRRLNEVAFEPAITATESMLIDSVCALSDHVEALPLAELEAHREAQQVEKWRTRARLRAEVWSRAYSAEFSGLRTSGDLRDHQDADHARQVARDIADAVAADFDEYCRREHMP